MRGLRHITLAGWFLLASSLAAPGTATAEADGVREHDVKAVFLFRFLQLIEWPASAFASSTSPILVGILEPDPFGEVLEHTLEGERIDARPIEIRRATNARDLQSCHLLFVPGRCNGGAVPPPLRPPHPGLLLVGETPGFLDQGGMVNFYRQGNQIRFEIRPEQVEQAGIRVRSRLLRLARVVDGPPPADSH